MNNYPRRLPDRCSRLIADKGFTLVELMVVILISMVMFGALFMVLNMGELQNKIGSTRIDVQQEVRRAMDMMITDLRQTARGQISVINSSGGADTFTGLSTPEVFEAPDFAICEDFVPGSGIQWSAHTVMYDLDATNETVIRTNTTSGQELRFRYINSLVFTKIATDTLQIDISGQKVANSGVGGSVLQVYNLSEEVKLRN